MSSISTITGSGGSGMSGIVTIDGDTGSVTGSTIKITAATGGSPSTYGSGTTLSIDFQDSNNNVVIGNGSIGLGTSTHSVGLGSEALVASRFGGVTGEVAIGWYSLTSDTGGQYNTAVGTLSLINLVNGVGNTALGYFAGGSYSGSESYNISINTDNTETPGENNTLRMGSGTGSAAYQLAQSFISGIQTIVVTGTPVLVSTGDQLGVATSSRRFKNDIQDMATDSSASLKLRPVTYTINKESAPGLKNATDERQFGLIAEEVAEVMPNLVNYVEGKPFSVKYEHLPAILLNELQKALKRIEILEAKVGA